MANDPVPEKLKSDLPPGIWGKILTATPVVMTVIATALAGLSSGEMNRAQYDRAGAAQLQAKASDQWSFFQAKRLRSALQGDVAQLLAAEHAAEANAAPVPHFTFKTTSAAPQMPSVIQSIVRGEADGMPDTLLNQLTGSVSVSDIEAAQRLAATQELKFNAEIAKFDSSHLTGGEKLQYASARYDAESRLDQDVAYLYEAQVRKSNLEAQRHHERSSQFFIGMLLAQMAVVIATFALAARKRNVLWTIAAVAGVAALIFSSYVYLAI
jgi:hypothetical protein